MQPVFGDDFCRVDLRLDEKGNPFILDIAWLSSMIPPEVSVTSNYPLKAHGGDIDYELLIPAVNADALRSYRKE